MRFAYYLLPAAVSALVAQPIEKLSTREQLLDNARSNAAAAAALPVVKTTVLKAQYRPTALRKKIRWGPVKLPAQGANKPSDRTMDSNGFSAGGTLEGLPTNATILMTQGQLVYEDGTPVGINSGTPHGSGDFCVGERAFTSRGGELIGWGQESNEDSVWMFTTQDGKLNSGWYRGPTARLSATMEVVNYQPTAKNLWMEMDIEYVPGKPVGLMDAHIQLVNIKGCRGAAGFKPPAGSAHKAWNLTGPPMNMGHDSYLFQQKGHVHDGGESMTVSINGRLVCTSAAKYGGKLGTIYDANGKEVEYLVVC